MTPSVGRIVHYVDHDRVHQAAIITAVDEEGVLLNIFDHRVQLQYSRRVLQSETPEVNTWHEPERIF